VARIYLF